VPVSREQVRRSIADHLQQRGAQHREAALRATSNDERQRHNRASADLDLAAKHIANQDEAHLDLNELYAWDQAHDQIGEYRWSPNDAQIAAIDAYTEDPTGGLDRLLSELNRLKS
jgi:hypothetical protein